MKDNRTISFILKQNLKICL